MFRSTESSLVYRAFSCILSVAYMAFLPCRDLCSHCNRVPKAFCIAPDMPTALQATAHFPMKRREISSSNFPRFDRNTNTGGTIATESEKDVVQAVNRVYHESMHPSYLLLPIIERS
jgi:hypothetical protein